MCHQLKLIYYIIVYLILYYCIGDVSERTSHRQLEDCEV